MIEEQEPLTGTYEDFQIIPNEQTPATPEIEDRFSFLGKYNEIFQPFLEFALLQPTAVGLAANQCSFKGERLMARMFALRNLETREWELIIDPKIIEYSGIEETKIEGCLTWKGRAIEATRSFTVNVEYYDIQGKKHNKRVTEFEAQIWQHEINHLLGVEEKVVEPIKSMISSKVQRNSPCPCGSGKKYKKCCKK